VSEAILVEDLRKSFGDTHALAGLDLSVAEGTVLGVLGPNGAGKTTAVRILATLLRPDGGHASVFGVDVVRHPVQVRTMIGLTGQYAAVDEYLTGRENLEMVGRLFRMGRRSAKRRAQELLEHFELTDAANRTVKTYSGGMRRRLDIAASLTARPRVLFLDEPTTGGERLEVTVGRDAQVTAAATALAGLGISEPTLDHQARQIRLPVSGGTRVLPDAVRALDAAAVDVVDLAVRRPTLDDVFLSLTGHAAEELPEKEKVPS
jgi:ABC-type Na+ transport system ATPase subunit NatA